MNKSKIMKRKKLTIVDLGKLQEHHDGFLEFRFAESFEVFKKNGEVKKLRMDRIHFSLMEDLVLLWEENGSNFGIVSSESKVSIKGNDILLTNAATPSTSMEPISITCKSAAQRDLLVEIFETRVLPALTKEDLVQGRVVLVRADFNVPINNDGQITENTRIVESLPTIKFLLENDAKRIHILSHFGRPNGVPNPEFSLKPVAEELARLLGEPVEFRNDFTASDARIQLHENVRFHAGEKTNDPAFANTILEGTKAEVFVNDGFGVSHRAHASVVGFANDIPCIAGKLVEKEIKHLSPFLSKEKIEGLSVVVGGAKMKTKVAVLSHFAKIADHIILGGGIANTFLAAQGINIGGSLYEKDQIETALKVLELAKTYGTEIHLPTDVVCSTDINSVETKMFSVEEIPQNMKIFDFGRDSSNKSLEIIGNSKVIIWNGPVGVFEKDLFSVGTRRLAYAIARNKTAKTILGGGDTLGALKKFNIPKSMFTHVSTAGGAMLEYLEGKELPGLEILEKMEILMAN